MSISRRKFLAAAGAAAVLGPKALDAVAETSTPMKPQELDDRAAPIVASLRQAFLEGQTAVSEDLLRITSEPGSIIRSLGEPTRGGITSLYHDSEITILHIVWAPLMVLRPHDHNMWASIGVYGGREDNIYWERRDHGIEAVGAESLGAGGVGSLASDAVHSVVNPIPKLTAAIHVYGGDFFAPGRTSWAGENHEPEEFNQKGLLQHFENSNTRFDI